MPDLELPPPDFAQLKVRTLRIEPAKLLRLAWPGADTHAGFRSTARFRFDSPEGSFGVLYAAFNLETVFAESALRNLPRESGNKKGVPIEESKLRPRRVIQFANASGARTLKLVQLYGAGLAAVRTDNQISAVEDYAVTQVWAKAFHAHPVHADGLIYMSRYTGSGKSIVLFDRCADKIAIAKVTPLLAHPEFAKIVDKFRLAIER